MPELPEVERVRRTLEPHLLGREIGPVRLRRRDICESWTTGPDGKPKRVRTTPAALLQGAVVSDLRRLGKQLAVVADDGRILCVHLGMSGKLIWRAQRPRVAPKHEHALWTLLPFNRDQLPEYLAFRDPRRFGGLWTFDRAELLESARWSALGPDALDLSGPHLARAIVAAKRPIKAALLDQAIAAGIGNIYADEALFRARIHPARLAASLTRADAVRLAAAVRHVLKSAIRGGGSTLRDYRDGNDQPGSHQLRHAVYGRSGKDCLRCRAALASTTIAGRTTVWCPRCQPEA